MKAVIIHGLLAVFGLGMAYQTWTRKPEENPAPGSVVAASCEEAAFQKIYLETPTHQITVEPKQDWGAKTYWITLVNKALEPPKPKTEGDKAPPPAAASSRQFLANATFAEYMKRIAPLRALRSLGTLAKKRDADFGFDKVGTFLKLQCGGRTVDYEVGERAFGASQRYFRDKKNHTTFLFDEQLVGDLESAAFKFMQTELHAFASEDVEEITVQAQGAKKRLLHRDRKLPEQALWVDASAAQQRNELYGNWFSRVARMRVRAYLAKGAEPGSDLKGQTGGTEPVLSVDYKVDGKPPGKLELVRVDENGVGHYYARTETTRGWVSVYDSAAKDVEQDVGMVVGTQQAPSKPSGAAPPSAASSTAAPVDPHQSAPGHPVSSPDAERSSRPVSAPAAERSARPALPSGHPVLPGAGPAVDPHAPH